MSAVSWTDSSGNLWLFGGGGLDSTGATGYLNDLWQFSPSTKMWSWVSGSNTANRVGIYGTKGSVSAGNVPGAREAAVSWIDSNGNLWLFGGVGQDSAVRQGWLNDTWRFSTATRTWTWINGSSSTAANIKLTHQQGQSGDYGAVGVPAGTNIPGGRYVAAKWIAEDGAFWLFGGNGFDSTGALGELNDLWRYQP